MTKIAGFGSASGSISQRHGSPDTDPHQNVMDPEHWLEPSHGKIVHIRKISTVLNSIMLNNLNKIIKAEPRVFRTIKFKNSELILRTFKFRNSKLFLKIRIRYFFEMIGP
jgi:hypothetical protein